MTGNLFQGAAVEAFQFMNDLVYVFRDVIGFDMVSAYRSGAMPWRGRPPLSPQNSWSTASATKPLWAIWAP